MTGSKGQLLSASQRNQAFQVLAGILDAAVRDKRLHTNPARDGAGKRGWLPTIPRVQRRRYLTHAEVATPADAAGTYGPFVVTLAYCGIRWGEATALRVRDVDLMKRRIHVLRSATDVNGCIQYTSPKTHAAREVSLPGFLREPLTNLTAGKATDDLVFSGAEGSPLRKSNFRSRVWLPALAKAGMEPMTVHDLRHTAASLAIESGANVKGVQRMLGHANAAMT